MTRATWVTRPTRATNPTRVVSKAVYTLYKKHLFWSGRVSLALSYPLMSLFGPTRIFLSGLNTIFVLAMVPENHGETFSHLLKLKHKIC